MGLLSLELYRSFEETGVRGGLQGNSISSKVLNIRCPNFYKTFYHHPHGLAILFSSLLSSSLFIPSSECLITFKLNMSYLYFWNDTCSSFSTGSNFLGRGPDRHEANREESERSQSEHPQDKSHGLALRIGKHSRMPTKVLRSKQIGLLSHYSQGQAWGGSKIPEFPNRMQV